MDPADRFREGYRILQIIRRNPNMAIKMRVLCASKKKLQNLANCIKSKYDLAFNSVDVIPPAYSCDKERVVLLAISAKGVNGITDKVRLFCSELTKVRAQNVALIIDGDEIAANAIKAILTEAGTNVIDEILYIKCGLFGGKPNEQELSATYAWVDRVIANLK